MSATEEEPMAGGFDDMAQRAVEAASAPGIDAETEEIASKSERIMRPSMAVSFKPLDFKSPFCLLYTVEAMSRVVLLRYAESRQVWTCRAPHIFHISYKVLT